MSKNTFDIQDIKKSASLAIKPLQKGDINKYIYGKRVIEEEMPPYYLVYFLLVKLLNYPKLGKMEKVAWSIPVSLKNHHYFIEYRKMGLGIFSEDESIEIAKEVLYLINRGIRFASPYFDYLAMEAVNNGKVNIKNNSIYLFRRFMFFMEQYETMTEDTSTGKNDTKTLKYTKIVNKNVSVTTYLNDRFDIELKSQWLAISAIESFFSWTEHIFVHIALLLGRVKTVQEITSLANKDWSDKYKTAIGFEGNEMKVVYDELVAIRKQLRNYIAHGAFGKQREAFNFHTETGAVPVLLPYKNQKYQFPLHVGTGFKEKKALEIIKSFIKLLWDDEREPAYYYLQETTLPIILTMANDGKYEDAMRSVNNMQKLIGRLVYEFDRAENMDW
jgi:hypothetical protein